MASGEIKWGNLFGPGQLRLYSSWSRCLCVYLRAFCAYLYVPTCLNRLRNSESACGCVCISTHAECVYVFVSGSSVEVRGPDSSPACVHQRANLIILITPLPILPLTLAGLSQCQSEDVELC